MRILMSASMLLLLAQVPALAAPACMARSGAQVVPLVELYTSEGCSSCPPADRWFSSNAVSEHGDVAGANWLAFHVDYWDAIGWPDRFASAAFTQRQRARVAAAGKSTVYTPQVMVGTQVQASWHGGIGAELRKARGASLAGLALKLQPVGSGWQVALGASRSTAAPVGDAQVWLAQYSDGQDSEVRAGENAGVHLHHDRVVRRLFGPWPLAGEAVSRQLALGAPSPLWGVTAFVQDATGRVWQSLTLPAAACATTAVR